MKLGNLMKKEELINLMGEVFVNLDIEISDDIKTSNVKLKGINKTIKSFELVIVLMEFEDRLKQIGILSDVFNIVENSPDDITVDQLVGSVIGDSKIYTKG